MNKVGLWNEHPPTPDYAVMLRNALDTSEHGQRVQVVGPDWHTGGKHVTSLTPFMEALHNNATVQASIVPCIKPHPKYQSNQPTNQPTD